MSFFDCVQSAVDGNEADKKRGERAQAMWKDMSAQYERQGHPRDVAESLAAEDVKASFKKEAGDIRHEFLAKIANMRDLQLRASKATPETIKSAQSRSVEKVDYAVRGLVRWFNGNLSSFLKDHHITTFGKLTDKAGWMDIVRELHGESTGGAGARIAADGIRSALEEMRIMFNEYGGNIGKLENWGLPHAHSRTQIMRAGFKTWFEDIAPDVNWKKTENYATGKPFQSEKGEAPSLEIQQRFLREIYDNNVYKNASRKNKKAIYGKPTGEGMGSRRSSHKRVLHFKSAETWVKYNKKYGTGDPFSSLMGHVRGMAHDIAMMREFGPNPKMGVEYQAQLFNDRVKALGDEKLIRSVEGDGKQAVRMLRVLSGPAAPNGPLGEITARFFANTRALISSALFSRAIVSTPSDFASMRLSAKAIGLNPANIVSTYAKNLADMIKSGTMATDDLLRHHWVMDTLADAGAALARFQQEVPTSEIINKISNSSMRIQGLPQHTDLLRFGFQAEMWGEMAKNVGVSLKDIKGPLGDALRSTGLTDKEWAAFADPKHIYTAGNKATFLNPLVWRGETTLPRAEADDIFLKLQTLVDDYSEKAVPTQSLYVRGIVDPAAHGLAPGSPIYELMKSSIWGKSFTFAFMRNQHLMIQAKGGYLSKGGAIHAAEMAASATVMGAFSLQVGSLIYGNDARPMDNPLFWYNAAMKGGGFAILGDFVQAGQTSWGGGFASYAAGPMWSLLGESYSLTFGNAIDYAQGKPPHLGKDIARFGSRYTPAGHTPVLGPALDRLLWDQLQLQLDPSSYKAMMQKAHRRVKDRGAPYWWTPGSPTPSRAPDLGTVFGQ